MTTFDSCATTVATKSAGWSSTLRTAVGRAALASACVYNSHGSARDAKSPLQQIPSKRALPLAGQAYDDLEHFETPFVVKLHRFNALANTQVACLPSVHVQ